MFHLYKIQVIVRNRAGPVSAGSVKTASNHSLKAPPPLPPLQTYTTLKERKKNGKKKKGKKKREREKKKRRKKIAHN